jgi:hypothetical protein
VICSAIGRLTKLVGVACRLSIDFLRPYEGAISVAGQGWMERESIEIQRGVFDRGTEMDGVRESAAVVL